MENSSPESLHEIGRVTESEHTDTIFCKNIVISMILILDIIEAMLKLMAFETIASFYAIFLFYHLI